MAPTEHTILTNFLLAPAALPSVVTMSSFKSFFPRAEQSSPEVKRLYHALQNNRSLLTDNIAESIELEVKRGNAQRQAVVRARRSAEKNALDEEVIIEKTLFGHTSNLQVPQPHSLFSVLPALTSAEDDLLKELQSLEVEVELLRADVEATVSGMSDLRYGKLSNPRLIQEVIESLGGLDSACTER